MQENEYQYKVIWGWRRDANKHKREDKGMYVIASIVGHYCYAVAMMYRLFGYENTNKFSNQWVTIVLLKNPHYN